jgi:hypothetical protein
VFLPDLDALDRIERALDRAPQRHGDTRLALAEHDQPVATVDTKLAGFCDALAGLAGAALRREWPGPARER